MARDQDHVRRHIHYREALSHSDAVEPRQVQIEQDKIDGKTSHDPKSLLATGSTRNNVAPLGHEEGSGRQQERGMIIDDQDSSPRHANIVTVNDNPHNTS